MPPNEEMIDEKSIMSANYFVLDKNPENEEVDEDRMDDSMTKEYPPTGPFGFKTPVKWSNVIWISIFHFIALYGFFTCAPGIPERKLLTLWTTCTLLLSGFGVTAGAHRYWTHRTFKAKFPLRIIMLFSFLLSGQYSIYDWVRDHRVHHKYTETDADPHNTNRGFFFAHVGWLMMEKHPEVLRRGRQIDMSDVLADPLVRFSQKYFFFLKTMICFVIPTVVPVYFWNESWYHAIMSQVFIRYILGLNFTWSVNSVAHFYGKRCYDKTIAPVENLFVSLVCLGEGHHNYHHIFPWDYKTSEYHNYGLFNMTTFWLDFYAKIGWAYDCKKASDDLIRKVTEKRGDGSHPLWGEKGTKKMTKISTD